MKDQAELTRDDDDDGTEAAAAALTSAGDTEGALKLKLDRMTKRLATEREKNRSRELGDLRTKIAAEFEYADPELITGRSEAELRASAERAHNMVAKVIESKGLVPKPAEETPEARKARESGNWGAPPPVATEAVTGESPMDWSDLQRAAITGLGPDGKIMDRAAILADIKTNQPRRITRQTIAGAALKGRAEAPTT